MLLGYPVVHQGQQVRYPLHVSNMADALVLLTRTNEPIEGTTYNLYGPRGYTYRRLVEMFAYASMTSCDIISLSPTLFWYQLVFK